MFEAHTDRQFLEEGLNKLIIFSQVVQHLIVAAEVDEHSQCILRNGLAGAHQSLVLELNGSHAQCSLGLEASGLEQEGVVDS